MAKTKWNDVGGGTQMTEDGAFQITVETYYRRKRCTGRAKGATMRIVTLRNLATGVEREFPTVRAAKASL